MTPPAVFAVALAVRLALLALYPGVHGDDSATRLAHADRLVLAYQLPLPQLLVAAMRGLAPHPAWTQALFAAFGAAIAPLLAAIVARLESPRAGTVAGLLAAVHPLLVYYSLVPYQEGPMLALLLAAALSMMRGRERTAAVWLGLACLCRYEAWIAAALVAARRRTLRAVLWCGAGPAAWIAFYGGLSPAGTYVLDLDPAAGRVHRLAFLAAKTGEYSGAVLTTLGVAGAAWVLWRGDPRWRSGALFVAAVAAAVVVAGHEFPPGTGQVSERLAHLPALGLCAGAAVGLSRAAERLPRRATVAAAALLLVLAADRTRATRALLQAAHETPDLRLAREVAAFTERRLGTRGRLAVAGPAVSEALVTAYVRKVERAGGDGDRARAVARDLSRLGPDAVRVAAHLARPAGTVVSAGEPAALLVVFDGVVPPPAPPAVRFEAGARNAAVYWNAGAP